MSYVSRPIRINNPYDANVLHKDSVKEAHGTGSDECVPLVDSPQRNSGLTDSDEESDTNSTKSTASNDSTRTASVLPFFSYHSQPVDETLSAWHLESLIKLFFGQVRRDLTPEKVAHLALVMSGGRRVFHVEAIVKWTNHRRPCGCFHVWVHPSDAEAFLATNRTALCDVGGFWVARSLEQKLFLEAAAAQMAAHRIERSGVPSQPVTVALATSHYSQAARAVNNEPHHRGPFPPHQRGARNARRGHPTVPFPVGF